MLLFYSTSTQAAALLEPYVGFNFAGKAGFQEKASVYGFGIGFRTGAKLSNFLIGVDMSFARLDNSDIEDGVNATDAGALFGYELDFGLRFWTAMNFLTVYSYDNYDFNGSGFKFGIGYTPIDYLSINLEYKEYYYFIVNERELNQDLTYRTLMISISAPFYF